MKKKKKGNFNVLIFIILFTLVMSGFMLILREMKPEPKDTSHYRIIYIEDETE